MATTKRMITSNNNFLGITARIISAAMLNGFNNNPRIISLPFYT
ncbi:hypothetical protein OAO35_02125 [Euryarchaeota archaeon]|nr:hypothetical protein [Euryarchaeota archaeon]